MEGMDRARTIGCLRGRLLAERTATKLAKNEAQLMETKLIELEYLLCEETKIKNKAEKRLSLLLNKLHSLEINYVVDDEDSENSGSIFSITTKDAKELQPKESDHVPSMSENSVDEAISEDAFSAVTTNSEPNAQICSAEKFLDMKSERFFNGEDHLNQRTDELKSLIEEHNADNSLPILSVSQTSLISEKTDEGLKMSDYRQSMGEALNALKHARREIERSMERRRLVKGMWTELILY